VKWVEAVVAQFADGDAQPVSDLSELLAALKAGR
jgi:hypothetical protein